MLLRSCLKIKVDLLEAVSYTSNGKTATVDQQRRVLEIVGEIESDFPPSPNLLLDKAEAQIIDGVWYLQYTSPSIVGDENQFPVSISLHTKTYTYSNSSYTHTITPCFVDFLAAKFCFRG